MRLIISDASEDDLDITPILLARQADIRFFIPEGKDEFFLNLETVLGAELPKITGPIYRLGKTYTDKNSEGFEEMYYYFRWRYAEPAFHRNTFFDFYLLKVNQKRSSPYTY